MYAIRSYYEQQRDGDLRGDVPNRRERPGGGQHGGEHDDADQGGGEAVGQEAGEGGHDGLLWRNAVAVGIGATRRRISDARDNET